MPDADGGTRTRTILSGQRILSPLRLPFRHIGSCQQARSGPPFCKYKKGGSADGNRSSRRKFFGSGWIRSFGQSNVGAGFDRAGRDVRSVTVMVNLGPENRYLFGSFNPDFNSVSVDSGDLDVDGITNDDPLVHLSG
jgi:hypothetical protein